MLFGSSYPILSIYLSIYLSICFYSLGEFTIVNKQLLEDLLQLGLWTPDIKNKLIAHGGSVQQIEEIPQELKALYKTVWEISQRTLINMAADRGAFIDQSQSFNVFIAEPTTAKLTSVSNIIHSFS